MESLSCLSTCLGKVQGQLFCILINSTLLLLKELAHTLRWYNKLAAKYVLESFLVLGVPLVSMLNDILKILSFIQL